MLQKTRGIVLRTLKYKDSSLIADVYTEVSGRTSFLLPVSRSRKAPVKTALFQPLAMVELEADYRPNATMYKVKEAKSFYPFSSLPFDPYKSAIALFLSEFLCRALREEAENRPLFAYLQHSVVWLDECRGGFCQFSSGFSDAPVALPGSVPQSGALCRGRLFRPAGCLLHFAASADTLALHWSAGGRASAASDAYELRDDAPVWHEPCRACPLSVRHQRLLSSAFA